MYSPERLTKLGDEAGKGGKGAFSLNDRIGLVQDAYVLAKSGYGKTSGALNLISKLKNEDENLVWREVASGLGDISDVWWDQPEKVRNGLDKLTIDTFKPLVKKLGWEISDSDSSDNRELRVTAIAAVARSGDEEALTEVRRRFALYTEQNDSSAIPGDFLDLILANAVRYGGEAEYEKVLAIYRKPATPQHKAGAMRALCATRDTKLLDRTFAFMKTDEVKMQVCDVVIVIRRALIPLAGRYVLLRLARSQPFVTSKALEGVAARSATAGHQIQGQLLPRSSRTVLIRQTDYERGRTGCHGLLQR